MEKHNLYFKYFKSYGLICSLFLIIILYLIICYLKNKEGFELINDSCDNITCDNINNKIIFMSGNNTSYNTIYDKFYTFVYDDISFNNETYNEQGNILKTLLEPHNLFVQNILLENIMTGHLYGTITNFPSKITATNLTNSLIIKSKNNYPSLNIHNYNLLDDNTFNTSQFTCITNFSNSFYYYNFSEINKYFKNIHNFLIPKGYFVINYINDFNNCNTLYGSVNKSKRSYLYMNYNYNVLNDNYDDNNIKIIESISSKLKKNKKRINTHILYKHTKEKLIHCAKKNNLELVQNIYKCKYKMNYGILIFKRMS